MTNLTNKELELRKWALEMSLEYGNALFPVVNRLIIPPKEIVYNAYKIMKLITDDWEKYRDYIPIKDRPQQASNNP
ncbi:MAG: hypothetical protein FWC10_09050 [Lentimicrobiaceae bacterium]|nr:hypothetical protein [Lentimicrobiaceae bacterium]